MHATDGRAAPPPPVPSLLCTPVLLWQSSGPRRLRIGAGRARAELARLTAAGALVLYDPAAPSAVELVHRHTGGPRTPIGYAALPLPVGEGVEAPRRVAREIARHGARTVAVVGGGSAMDTAKLAAVLAVGGEPRFTAGPRSGLALLSRTDRPAPAVIAFPTTLGTGSETSGVARLPIGERRSRLVCSTTLCPAGAVLDPCLTSTLPRPLLAAGALEILLRLAGPLLGPHPMADAAAEWLLEYAALVRRTADKLLSADTLPSTDRSRCGETEPAAALRLRLATVSAASHQVWPRVGVSPFAFLLWYFADTAATVTGTAKNAALARLFPAYLELALGVRGRSAWADGPRARRVARVLFPEAGPDPAHCREAAVELLRRWGIAPVAPLGADPGRLGSATVASWPRALTDITAKDAAALYERANALC
ncbi:iron-containing alcohol dehydrogenase [Streptomyces huasconensis]|uniref:iron-containing alcohol dehydrogenase n=1 Tax=Streptomyces huasconensis TaxID=1854574 RepID=UPI0036F90942